jgi:hypothetical protein
VADQASQGGVRRIIYLGGLGNRDSKQSAHLRSRHETADLLRTSKAQVTELRAAVIVGSGSLSFELIHHLVNRLPVMICPRWVMMRTQPIAIDDVLAYLLAALEVDGAVGKSIDIGGPEVLTYADMMKEVAKALGLKRLLIRVPVLTPRLSSYWLNLVTPLPFSVARTLVESLRFETVRENNLAERVFSIKPKRFAVAVADTLAQVKSHSVETAWTDATSTPRLPAIDDSHLQKDTRIRDVRASARTVFDVIKSIGGDNGWYFADWLWKIRGFIDKQLGGAGLRRGRRHPSDIAIGDALDFWRVEDYIFERKLLLRAEMKVWGQAWLEFSLTPLGENKIRLTQNAVYYPKGLFGLVYWFSIYPIHAYVFRGLIRAIAERSEALAQRKEMQMTQRSEA